MQMLQRDFEFVMTPSCSTPLKLAWQAILKSTTGNMYMQENFHFTEL